MLKRFISNLHSGQWSSSSSRESRQFIFPYTSSCAKNQIPASDLDFYGRLKQHIKFNAAVPSGFSSYWTWLAISDQFQFIPAPIKCFNEMLSPITENARHHLISISGPVTLKYNNASLNSITAISSRTSVPSTTISISWSDLITLSPQKCLCSMHELG